MVAAVLWLDPAFFYPRLQTDPLLYFLKAKSLVETGSTSATLAVNDPPFAYAALPGVLRAPMVYMFNDFDTQWRAIQLLNIPVVASVALMSAYMVSWTQPQSRHWMTIAFAFAFTLLSPVWIANVFSPLVDAPYAAFTLFALLVAIRIFCSPGPIRRERVLIAVFAITFTIAFFLRFTAPVLFVFAATLARGRWKGMVLSRAARRRLIVGPAGVTLVLILLNFHAIFGRYLLEPLSFVLHGDKGGMLLNLFGLAVADQIMPDFHLGFSQPPVIDTLYGEFAHTPFDAAWTIVGLSIAAIVLYGMWLSRHRFLPEILYLLAPLTILALMMPSTSRYLMSYQPLFWLFFSEGAAALAMHFAPAMTISRRSRAMVVGAALTIVAVAGWLRWSRIVGTGADRSYAVSLADAPAYARGVSGTFRSLRDFLETLPRDRTLLVGTYGLTGRWKAIADRSYYTPDSALVAVAAQKEVYLIVECGTLEYCQSYPEWKNRMKEKLCSFGEFTYDSVFAARSKWARAEVFRVKPAT
ncbi:MAG: hypothetical protein ABIQ55_00340 [Gemmatimonadaceae bacterium]